MDSAEFTSSYTAYNQQRFGSYLIERPLGQGAFATVYLGVHDHLDTEAAIKVLHHRCVDSERERFKDEARMAARLIHPHIVRVFEYGLRLDKPYLVMDYAVGGSLSRFRGAKLPLPIVVDFAKQIASGLDYLHGQGIIHCDIKPQNLLIGHHEQILIGDFGIALGGGSATAAQESIVRGTPLYMAPEQFSGEPCFASDQYALAVVLYELLCGVPPFRGTGTSVTRQDLHAVAPSLRRLEPSIPPAVEDVILRALERDPRQRYDSAGQFAMALEDAASEPSRTIFTAQHSAEETPDLLSKAAQPAMMHRQPSRPENRRASRFTVALLCFSAMLVAGITWSLGTLLPVDAQLTYWVAAFCLTGCAFTTAIFMRHRQALYLITGIFALALLSAFMLHSVLAYLVVSLILLGITTAVALSLALRGR